MTWKQGHDLCATCARREACTFYQMHIRHGAQRVVVCGEYVG